MSKKKLSKPCPWCIEGRCRTKEDICDFKTLKKEPEAIKKRIDEEFAKVKDLFVRIKKATDQEAIQKDMADVHDRLSGIKTMRDALSEEFGQMHMPGDNPFEFTKLIIDARLNALKFERKKK